MYFLPKQIAFILIIAACCLLTVSCNDSRVVQCTKLTEIVTKGNTLIEIKKDSYDIGTTKNLAKDLNQTSKQLESLGLTDVNLKEFQSQSIKSFRQMSQALGDIGKALEAGNRASTSIEGRGQIQKAQADIVKAGQQANEAAANQDVVTEKLIKYCSNQS
jgi:hypothetical protein